MRSYRSHLPDFGVVVLAAIALALVGLTGCSSTSTPAVVPSPLPTIAGEYTGTVADSVSGNGTSAITIAQKGSSIGGNLIFTYGAASQTFALAGTIDTTGSVAGSALATIANATCAFNVTGTYNGTNGVLTGSYSSFNGCSGQTGTFTLTQQCTDPSSATRRRPARTGILPC